MDPLTIALLIGGGSASLSALGLNLFGGPGGPAPRLWKRGASL